MFAYIVTAFFTVVSILVLANFYRDILDCGDDCLNFNTARDFRTIPKKILDHLRAVRQANAVMAFNNKRDCRQPGVCDINKTSDERKLGDTWQGRTDFVSIWPNDRPYRFRRFHGKQYREIEEALLCQFRSFMFKGARSLNR